MFSTLTSVLLALTGVSLLLHRVGMWAVWRYTRRDRAALGDRMARIDTPFPPLTLLKPIKGIEDGLRDNLRSFYEQDYPGALQVVFTSTETDDPGIACAREIAEAYPLVTTTFVHARDDFGLNPKVSNMQGGLLAAAHDLILQSDANVRLRPGYLRRIVGTMLAEDASLVGSIVVGVGERSVGATLDNLQLTAFTAPGLCMAEELAGITCVLGKAMLLRKSELEALGGLGCVRDVLAEDYILTQRYQRAGKRVVLCTDPVENINIYTSPRRFFARHSRWLKMRAVVSVPGYLADLGSNSLPWALAALIASGGDARVFPVAIGAYLYKCYWDARLLHRLRGHGMGLAQLWATPLRDLTLTLIWVYALFSRSTEWRGRPLLLSAGSVLVRNDGPLSLRLRRRIGLLRS